MKPTPLCGQHKIFKEWRPTAFEYRDKGIFVRIPNVYAWICPMCGDREASFTSETTDELIDTVKELVEAANHARQRRSIPTEYLVSIA